jgi:riboflavin kinase / FMN adenylyltransferase
MSANARVFRGIEAIPADFGPCALTIGNFDGVHAGHREILRRVVRAARAGGWKAAALTFDPHPLQVVAPERAPVVMTSPEERARLMGEEGIEEVLILPFTREVSSWSPEFFVRDLVCAKLQAQVILVGQDFRFGHKHAGDVALLAKLGVELGFQTELISPVKVRGKRVSSSLVRELVESGDVSAACRFLARPFYVDGVVVKGQGIGSTKTVPTLNIEPGGATIPKTGVYITNTRDLDSGRSWQSITNVGYRPTFDGQGLTIETFLLQPLERQPERIRVEFRLRLRDERKFESPEALKAQILRDVRRAQTWFRRTSKTRVKMDASL